MNKKEYMKQVVERQITCAQTSLENSRKWLALSKKSKTRYSQISNVAESMTSLAVAIKFIMRVERNALDSNTDTTP